MAEGFFEAGDVFGGVGVDEFLGLPDASDFEDGCEEIEDIEDGGDAFAEGDIDGFDFRPVGEGPVGDDEGVGVADARDEVEDVWVEDAGLEHGWMMG